MDKNLIKNKINQTSLAISSFFDANDEKFIVLAQNMAELFKQGRTLFVIGNGGSACDAEHVMVEFNHPIFTKRKSLACIALTPSSALITAISNDEDFSMVFNKPLQNLAKPQDMLMALSSSGMSSNLINAFKLAQSLNLFTLAFLGKDGGRLAKLTDNAFIVPSYSIHRIQETHVVMLHILWDLIHICLGEEDIV